MLTALWAYDTEAIAVSLGQVKNASKAHHRNEECGCNNQVSPEFPLRALWLKGAIRPAQATNNEGDFSDEQFDCAPIVSSSNSIYQLFQIWSIHEDTVAQPRRLTFAAQPRAALAIMSNYVRIPRRSPAAAAC